MDDTLLDVRAESDGIVAAVLVDEGATVAEETELVTLDVGGGEVRVATTVPGVVREIDVAAGDRVVAGDVLVRIDTA